MDKKQRMQLWRSGHTAAYLGINRSTLLGWADKNILRPDFVSAGGHRYYSPDKVARFLRSTPQGISCQVRQLQWRNEFSTNRCAMHGCTSSLCGGENGN